MKNKYLITAGILSLILFGVSPVVAQGNQYRYQEIQEPKANSAQVKTQNQGENTRVETQFGRTDVAAKHAARIQYRFENYTAKFEGLINRIQQVIDGMNNEYKEKAQAKLDQAKVKLNEASLDGESASQAFLAIEPNMYQSQRQQALAASELAKQSRFEYMETLSLLKDTVKIIRQADSN